MKLIFLLLFSISFSAFADQDGSTWDGKYDHINCGTAEECKGVAGNLNIQGRYLDSMPYMAQACIKGGHFCFFIGGILDKRSKDKAFEWHKKDCEMGRAPKNCYAAINYLIKKEPLLAKQMYKEICNDSNDLNCIFGLSNKDSAERKMIAEACKEGHHVACNIAVQYHSNKSN